MIPFAKTDRLVLVLAILGALGVACAGGSKTEEGSETHADSAVDTVADIVVDAPTDVGPDFAGPNACSAPDNDGPTVAVELRTSKFEAAIGGTIIPGRYHLTRVEVRSGDTTGSRQFVRTIYLSPTQWLEADRDPSVGGADEFRAGSVALSGTSFLVRYTCGPTKADDEWVYSSDGTTLLLMNPASGGLSSFIRFTCERR